MKKIFSFVAVFFLSVIDCMALCVIDFGAKGDGVHNDTEAINAAILKAHENGGGVVTFPKGEYLTYSVHLMSNVTIRMESRSVIKAAPVTDSTYYDLPEPNASTYQDFGHSHWQNSLMWGIGLSNVTIEGDGIIDGTGVLTRGQSIHRNSKVCVANKALAMKDCNNVTVRGVKFLSCGHFAMLLTGVDNLLIEDVTADTNRDGFDIDCCKDVVVRRCKVNTQNDDAIVLKCSYALGWAKPTENVLIEDCEVSGYDIGTLMDGTYGTKVTIVPDQDGPTGRIKLGTESNGGFYNITIRNCKFTHCRGLAIETVDGAAIKNVNVSNITMRDICNSPIYIRLGDRMRGPDTLPCSSIDGICISNVKVVDADCRYGCLILGLKDQPICNVTLRDIDIQYRGGLTKEDYRKQIGANHFFLKHDNKYPEPSAHGIQAAWGMTIEYAKNIKLENVKMNISLPDERKQFAIKHVSKLKKLRDRK